MTKSEVMAAIKELRLFPSDLFNVDDLVGDSKVADKLREDNTYIRNNAERFRKERDEARDKVASLENEKSQFDQKLKSVEIRHKSTSVLDTVLKDKEGLSDKAKAFIRYNAKHYTPKADDEDSLKRDLEKFVDDNAKEYTEVFGDDTEEAKSNENTFTIPPELMVNRDTKTGTKAPDKPEQPVTRDQRIRNEMNPNINPMIPGGKAAKESQPS